MTLTIYGITQSRARRVLWLAEELGLAYEQRQVAQKDCPTDPDLGRVNPLRQIPAIEDAGFALSQSLAITLYLAKKHGGPLAPANLQEDAEMTAWSFLAATDCEPAALQVLMHSLRLPAEKREPAKVEAAFATLKRPLDVIEAHLAKHGHLVGGRFTVADLNLASVLAWLLPAREQVKAWPVTVAWLQAASQRPAHQRVK